MALGSGQGRRKRQASKITDVTNGHKNKKCDIKSGLSWIKTWKRKQDSANRQGTKRWMDKKAKKKAADVWNYKLLPVCDFSFPSAAAVRLYAGA